jgi:hypothetical protein
MDFLPARSGPAARSGDSVTTAAQPDEAAITRHLRRLGTAYPGFTFSYATLGRKGRRWTAERQDRAASGLIMAITGDLLELHAALQRDKARHAG